MDREYAVDKVNREALAALSNAGSGWTGCSEQWRQRAKGVQIAWPFLAGQPFQCLLEYQ